MQAERQSYLDSYYNHPDVHGSLSEERLVVLMPKILSSLKGLGITYSSPEAFATIVSAESEDPDYIAESGTRKYPFGSSINVLLTHGQASVPHYFRFRTNMHGGDVDFSVGPDKKLHMIRSGIVEGERKEVTDRYERAQYIRWVGIVLERSNKLKVINDRESSFSFDFDTSLIDWASGARPIDIATYESALKQVIGDPLRVYSVPEGTRGRWNIEKFDELRSTYVPGINPRNKNEREIVLGNPDRRCSLIFEKGEQGEAQLKELRWDIDAETQAELFIESEVRSEDNAFRLIISRKGQRSPIYEIEGRGNKFGFPPDDDHTFFDGFIINKNRITYELGFSWVLPEEYEVVYGLDEAENNKKFFPMDDDIGGIASDGNIFLSRGKNREYIFHIKSRKPDGKWLKLTIPQNPNLMLSSLVRNAIFNLPKLFQSIEFTDNGNTQTARRGEIFSAR